MSASIYPRPLRRQKNLTQNIVYISPTRHASGEVFLGEVLNRPDLYEEMLAILKEFDENILSINYILSEQKLYVKIIYGNYFKE